MFLSIEAFSSHFEIGIYAHLLLKCSCNGAQHENCWRFLSFYVERMVIIYLSKKKKIAAAFQKDFTNFEKERLFVDIVQIRLVCNFTQKFNIYVAEQ